jgi:transposase
VTQKFLRDNGVTFLEKDVWPAFSCDLNPVEQVFSILQRHVSDRGPWQAEDIAKFVREEWEKIPQALIDTLVLSFRKRLEKVVARDGKCIN